MVGRMYRLLNPAHLILRAYKNKTSGWSHSIKARSKIQKHESQYLELWGHTAVSAISQEMKKAVGENYWPSGMFIVSNLLKILRRIL